jgi:hypothetical protein
MDEVEMLSRVLASAVTRRMETINNQNNLLPTIEGRVDCQRQFLESKGTAPFYSTPENFNHPALDILHSGHNFRP